MASEWAEEADRQARALTRELAAAGQRKGAGVTYQKREARFALKVGRQTFYFAAHDYDTAKGMDWRRLRKDILKAVYEIHLPDETGA